MAISKITLNGVTQMDVTQKTVTANTMLNGVTALKNDGTDIAGNIQSKTSSDLTVSGATVTAPAGNYQSAASKTIPNADVTVGDPSFAYTTESGARKWGFGYSAFTESAGYIGEGQFGVHSYKYNAIAKNTSVTPTESAQTIGGENTMMEGAVTVNAIPSNYVGSGITQRSSSDLTASGATVTAPAGYYGSAATKSVASGTAGTPTATKGTVSNHSVTITPSVTNTTGYITGGSKTGTAVSVSASELVSGTKSISSSGTTDVTNYASASVAAGTEGTPTATKGTVSGNQVTVTPSVTNSAGYISGGTHTGTGVTVAASELVSGSQTFSRNGTFNVANLAQIITNFSSLSECEFGTFTPATDVVTYNITFANTHTGLPCFAIVVNSEESYDTTTYTNAWMIYYNFQEFFRAGFKVASSSNNYGAVHVAYRTTGTSSLVFSQYPIYYGNTNTSSSNNAYPRYWVTESGMRAEATSTSYWRSNRTYSWAAFWNPRIDPSWEIGAINTNTGETYNLSTRIRAGIYIPVNSSIRVYPKSGTKVSVFGWNSSYAFVSSSSASSWTSTEFNLINKIGVNSGMSYVKLMAAYTDDREITDVGALADNIIIRGIT